MQKLSQKRERTHIEAVFGVFRPTLRVFTQPRLAAATRVFRSTISCLKGRFRASQLLLFAPVANHQPPIQSMCVTVANCSFQPVERGSRPAARSACETYDARAANGRFGFRPGWPCSMTAFEKPCGGGAAESVTRSNDRDGYCCISIGQLRPAKWSYRSCIASVRFEVNCETSAAHGRKVVSGMSADLKGDRGRHTGQGWPLRR